MNIREQKGYSYGVFSFPQLYSAAGTWRAFGTVQADKTKESVIEFLKELDDIAGAKPVTAEELAHAVANRIRGYAQQFEAVGQIAGEVGNLWTLGMPMTELEQLPEELGKTSLDSVRAVAAKYAAARGSTLLLIGNLSMIETGVRRRVGVRPR